MAIWNPSTKKWDDDDPSNQLWNPKEQEWTSIKSIKNDKKENTVKINNPLDFGKVALKTAGNIATNMGEGALKGIEGVMDFSSYLANKINAPLQEKAEVLTGISTKKEAKKNRNKSEKATRDFIATNYEKAFTKATGFEDIRNDWEKDSLVKENNLGGSISRAVGEMVPTLLIGNTTNIGPAANSSYKGLSLGQKALTLGKNFTKQAVSNLGANTTLATNTYGNALEEAYQNGANDSEATKYAIGSSATELATEWITGGIPGIDSTGILDKGVNKLINKSTGKIKSNVVKNISKAILNAGYEMVGEGAEEALSEIISPALKNATYSKNEKINWNNVFESAIVGGLTGGILNIPNNISEFKSSINESKATLPTGSINKNIPVDDGNPIIENSSISLPMANIKQVENNATNVNTTLPISSSSLMQLPLSNNTNDLSNPLLNQNQVKLPSIENNIYTSNNKNQSQNSSNNQISEIPQTKNISDRYQYNASENNKINNLRESAEKYLNNSDDSKSFIEIAEKVINDKNYNVLLDSSITNDNGNSVNAQIKKLDNGEMEIRINPNSDRAGEFLLTHEITHSIETKEMKNLVMDYASKNSEFNNALESLKETYNTTDVSDEVLADISGQLFGNQEFINNLSIEKTSIFKKIYNSIISLANKITGNSKESLFIEDLRNKWEKAYRSNNNVLNDTKYMMTSIKGMTNGINADTKYNNIKERYDAALYLENKNYNNEKIRQLTGWFKDNKGNWEFEISDKNSGLKMTPKIDTTYKLIDLFKANTLYDMYPDLKNVQVSFKNIKASGNFDTANNKININNDHITNNSQIRGTLLHEIQHYIQHIENLPHGTSIIFGKKQYVNSKGEIEAADTRKRMDLSVEERKKIIPESSKKEPIHPNKNAILNNKQNMIEKLAEKLYNKFGDKNNEEIESNYIEDDAKNIQKNNGKDTRGLRNLDENKELNDSSFSLEKNSDIKTLEERVSGYKLLDSKDLIDEVKNVGANVDDNESTWKKHLEKNYKQKGITTNLNSIRIKDPILPFNKIANLKSIKEENKQKIENNTNSVKRLTQEKNATMDRIKEKIKLKTEEYKSKVNKDTKVANNLNQQIALLNNQLQNRQVEYDARIERLNNRNEKMNGPESKIVEQRQSKIEEYSDLAYSFTENMLDWKDKKRGIDYQKETMKRNLYDIMDKSTANKIYKTYFQTITENNAKSEKFINSYNDEIKSLNLNDKESIAVQMLGEYKYNSETQTLLTGEQVTKYLEDNHLDVNKIENAVEKFRTIYDDLIVQTNKILKEQGYNEIEYRKGYFPHFREEKPINKFSKLAEKMGFKVKKDILPTDIAGITDTFSPGKTWFGNAQQRKGKITDYNALKGFDNYIRGTADLIYHTEDIQKLRQLEKVIRYQYTDSSIQDQIKKINKDLTLSLEEKTEKFKELQSKINNPLGNFVTELKNYTDNLANKKSFNDRSMEQLLGRETYSIMTNIQSRVSANMVGLNISSALTNFIPITQAYSQCSTKNMLKAIKETISSSHKTDSLSDASVFLTNRNNQADRLSKTFIEKANQKASVLFEGIDDFTSNVIVRAKYYENIDKGMTEFKSMQNADEYAKDIMAGRDKGSLPTIFNRKSPVVKLVSAFQLEVNNQYGYMLKDIPRDLKEKGLNKLLSAYIKMFVGAWLYNKFSESVTGRKSAFSPIDLVSDSIKTVHEDSLNDYEKLTSISKNMLDEVPFVGGFLGGGRLPISSALPDVETTLESFFDLGNSKKRNNAIKNLTKELSKPLFYVVAPFGGGQLKKTVEGLSMYTHNTPGSYTTNDKLRFTTKKDPLSVVKNTVFGQYSSKNAREYFDKGYAPIDSKTLNKITERGVSINTYRKYEDDYKKIKTSDGKLINEIKAGKSEDGKPISGSSIGKKAYLIINSKFSEKEKKYMLSKLTNSDNQLELKDLQKLNNNKELIKMYCSSSDKNKKAMINEINTYNINTDQLYEYYNTRKNLNSTYTSKYTKEKMLMYLSSSNLDNKTKLYLYNKDYGSKTAELVIKSFNLNADNYLNTIQYAQKIEQEYPGTKKSKYRKQRIFSYINNLKISKNQKIALFSQVGYSTSINKKEMYEYVNNLALSKIDKEKIWKSLY